MISKIDAFIWALFVKTCYHIQDKTDVTSFRISRWFFITTTIWCFLAIISMAYPYPPFQVLKEPLGLSAIIPLSICNLFWAWLSIQQAEKFKKIEEDWDGEELYPREYRIVLSVGFTHTTAVLRLLIWLWLLPFLIITWTFTTYGLFDFLCNILYLSFPFSMYTTIVPPMPRKKDRVTQLVPVGVES